MINTQKLNGWGLSIFAGTRTFAISVVLRAHFRSAIPVSEAHGHQELVHNELADLWCAILRMQGRAAFAAHKLWSRAAPADRSQSSGRRPGQKIHRQVNIGQRAICHQSKTSQHVPRVFRYGSDQHAQRHWPETPEQHIATASGTPHATRKTPLPFPHKANGPWHVRRGQ